MHTIEASGILCLRNHNLKKEKILLDLNVYCLFELVFKFEKFYFRAIPQHRGLFGS